MTLGGEKIPTERYWKGWGCITVGRMLVLAHLKPWAQSQHYIHWVDRACLEPSRRKQENHKFSHPQPHRKFEANLELHDSL